VDKKVGVPDPAISIVPPPALTVKDRDTSPETVPVVFIVPTVEAEPNVIVLDALPRLFVKLDIDNIPCSIFIDFPAPPKVFVALSIKVEEPVFVRLNAPDITPLRVMFPLPPIDASDPKATVPFHSDADPLEFVNAPELEIPVPLSVNASVADEFSEYPFISKTPPELTVVPTAVVPNGPEVLDVDETPSFNVALELIVVVPEYVFAELNTTLEPESPPILVLFVFDVEVLVDVNPFFTNPGVYVPEER